MSFTELLHIRVHPDSYGSTEELQPQRLVYASHLHFRVVGFQVEWDSVPVETADSFDHSLNGLLRRFSPHRHSSECHHHFGHHLLKVIIFQLHPLLPPLHVGFTKYVAVFRGYVSGRRQDHRGLGLGSNGA